MVLNSLQTLLDISIFSYSISFSRPV